MIIRLLFATVVVAIAVLVTPEMLKPGVNSADFIVMAAPLALVAIFAYRRPEPPAGDSAPPNRCGDPNAAHPAGSPSSDAL